jgi:hypothetical protein
MALAQPLAGGPLLARRPVASRRVRPFTPAIRGSSSRLVARAAEPEAAVEEFTFSLADAKKGNEYQPSDVEAALRFYQGEGDAPGSANSEFVENVFGIEDASFFDDIDNNEAYDDEFIAAGIPEAAPKQQGRARADGGDKGEDEGADGSDPFAAAKALARLQEKEEELLAGELDTVDSDGPARTLTMDSKGPAVWDWMNDLEVEEDDEELSALAGARAKSVSASVLEQLPSDEQVFADLRNANLQEIDTETRDAIEFLLDDFDIENEVKAVPDSMDAAEAVYSVPADADVAFDASDLDELLDADLSVPELEEMAKLEDVDALAAEEPLAEATVQGYLASLKAAKGLTLSDAEVSPLSSHAVAAAVRQPASSGPGRSASLPTALLRSCRGPQQALTARVCSVRCAWPARTHLVPVAHMPAPLRALSPERAGQVHVRRRAGRGGQRGRRGGDHHPRRDCRGGGHPRAVGGGEGHGGC